MSAQTAAQTCAHLPKHARTHTPLYKRVWAGASVCSWCDRLDLLLVPTNFRDPTPEPSVAPVALHVRSGDGAATSLLLPPRGHEKAPRQPSS